MRLDPPPGRATEEDVDRFDCHEDRLYELIDGVLVEKVYDFRDAIIAGRIGFYVSMWNEGENAGVVTGGSAPFRFGPRQVRMPDAAFISWDRLPGGRLPRRAVPDLVPNLAVEVVNPANTPGEMSRKLWDYFDASVELVWVVDPRGKQVDVFTAVDDKQTVGVDGTLDGGGVLPGFKLPVRDIFASRAPAKKGKKKGGK